MALQHVQKKFDSDCVIRWLQKWREMLFTTRVVSLLTIVSVFVFYHESILLFFLESLLHNFYKHKKTLFTVSTLLNSQARPPIQM